jgi:hypothetical protein
MLGDFSGSKIVLVRTCTTLWCAACFWLGRVVLVFVFAVNFIGRYTNFAVYVVCGKAGISIIDARAAGSEA